MSLTRRFKSTISTVNLWPSVGLHVGSSRHDKLIDEIATLRNYMEEERLLVYYESGESYEDSGRVLGVMAEAFAQWYRAFKKRAR